MILRNTIWNTAGLAADVVAGFVVAPVLIASLGHSTYGVWIVLSSLISFLTLLDLGVRATVARTVAFYRAKQDCNRISETLTTSLGILSVLGAVAFGVMVAAAFAFPTAMGVPADQVDMTGKAMLFMGGSIFLTLALSPYDGALWAYQRFDRLNMVNIPATLIRSGGAAVIAMGGGGLVELSLMVFVTTAIASAAKVILATRCDTALRFGAEWLTRRAFNELFGISLWVVVGTATRVFRLQLGPILIAILLGAAAVTPFSVANRLSGIPATLLVTVATVTTPVATRAFALNRSEDLRRLLFTSGKYLFAVSLGMTAGLMLLGRPLISLWVGPELADSFLLLTVLAAGESLPNTQWVSQSILGAALRYRVMAYLALAELVAMVLLAVFLVGPFGTLGVCLAVAIPGLVLRGGGLFVLASRVAELSAGRYLATVAAPATTAVAFPILALVAGIWYHQPETWFEIAGYVGGFGVLFGASCLMWFPELRTHNLFRRFTTKRPANLP